jgi:hypothetical protein
MLMPCVAVWAAAAAVSYSHKPLAAAAADLSVLHVRTEQLVNPLGLDKPQPRFSWVLDGGPGARSVSQISYQIRVGDNGVADGSVWDSGPVSSNRSYMAKYAGAPLVSGRVYHWSVAVTATMTSAAAVPVGDEENRDVIRRTTRAMSTTAHFSMGMLSRAAWGRAEFIGLGLWCSATNQQLRCCTLPASATMS